MEIQIREAQPDDAQALWVLAQRTYIAAFGHSMTPADLEAHLKNHLSFENVRESLLVDFFLLACVEDAVIGFIQFGESHLESEHIVQTAPIVFQPQDREIRRLYVFAPYQNFGIGSQLMDAALSHLRLATHGNIFLDVWEENTRAQKFYRRYGFEKVAEKHFHVDSGAETGVDFIMLRRP